MVGEDWCKDFRKMKMGLKKRWLYAKVQAFKQAHHWMTDEEIAWEFMPSVGREFGSPDYERLMAQDAVQTIATAVVNAKKSSPI